ncbi:hypothetical protein CMZ84_03785 [Lysobacteraceae bacterium NML93-0399]|nr:hypothetical protein CMZ84_03785 [Xanthomonadaceae bacterium NML93-0399]
MSTWETPMQKIDDLMERLLESSRSFRKRSGRHVLRTEDVVYCAFSTPGFSVPRALAQRDAARRLTRFGLDRSQVAGRTVLDLGCNAGAMLFELTNRGVLSGRGIEFDLDKVELAREISRLSQLTQLQFEQGDIDRVDAADLGLFDVVLALAIESHVLDQNRLLALLAEVTGQVLCFEGNAGCDIREIGTTLLKLGFDGIEYLGTCDDDLRAANNRRPLLKAWRTRRRSGSRPFPGVSLPSMQSQSAAEVVTHAAMALRAEAAMETSGCAMPGASASPRFPGSKLPNIGGAWRWPVAGCNGIDE